MVKSSFDESISRIFRLVGKKDVEIGILQRSQDELRVKTQGLPEETRKLILRGFEMSRDYWNVASRFPETDYVRIIKQISETGFYETATAVFITCASLIAKINFDELVDCMPSIACITAWVKASNVDEKVCLKTISSKLSDYYSTTWVDWFASKAAVSDLVPLIEIAITENKRPAHLSGSSELLLTLLRRDRKSLITASVVSYVSKEPNNTRTLITALAHEPEVAEIYARGFGMAFANKSTTEEWRVVLSILEEMILGEDEYESQFAAQFTAHINTTFALVTKAPGNTSQGIEEALLNLSVKVLLFAQGNKKRNQWLAITTKTITDKILTGKGKVSPQGGVDIALALRAAESGSEPLNALWSAAFNLGIREIGKTGAIESFDPFHHEDIRGGLLQGHEARIIRSGWKHGETVLLRAEVEPI